MEKEIKVINLMIDKVLVVVGQDNSVSTYQNNEQYRYYLLQVPVHLKSKDIPLEDIKMVARENLNNYELLIKNHIDFLMKKYKLSELKIAKKHFAEKISEHYKYTVLPNDIKSLLQEKWGLEYQQPSRVKYPVGFDDDGNVIFEESVQRCFVIRRKAIMS